MNKDTPVLKTDTEENWNKAVNYIPKKNEIIVYEYDGSQPRLKLGNGIHKLSELPFLTPTEPSVNNDVLKL